MTTPATSSFLLVISLASFRKQLDPDYLWMDFR